jgi:two-component system sensor histidine kinase VicK
MSRLVNELLTMAQLDAPTWPETLHIYDLKNIMHAAEREMAPQFRARQQEFKLRLCDELAFVLAPQDRVEQVCINLLSNASKYTPDGGSISLELKSGVTGSEIIIRDSGIGIPEEHLPRIFERFYRVEKGRSRAQGGTGLGLAIAKQIVEKLGGSIHLVSEAGRGTEVTVWLPKPEQFAVWGGDYYERTP